jgi:hypothetical protein
MRYQQDSNRQACVFEVAQLGRAMFYIIECRLAAGNANNVVKPEVNITLHWNNISAKF